MTARGERPGRPTLWHRMLHYYLTPGGPLRMVGVALAVGALPGPPLWHTPWREVGVALGAASMLWWLGYQLREKAERIAGE